MLHVQVHVKHGMQAFIGRTCAVGGLRDDALPLVTAELYLTRPALVFLKQAAVTGRALIPPSEKYWYCPQVTGCENNFLE